MVISAWVIATVIAFGAAQPGSGAFQPGPAIPEYGPLARVEGALPIPPQTTFRIAFDVAENDDPTKPLKGLTTPARFLNMHSAAGVADDKMELAIIVHGKAVQAVRTDGANVNAPLIAALLSKGVKITVCGQSAAYYGVGVDELLPGVTMSLSAMTAHALFQQAGYTLNPF